MHGESVQNNVQVGNTAPSGKAAETSANPINIIDKLIANTVPVAPDVSLAGKLVSSATYAKSLKGSSSSDKPAVNFRYIDNLETKQGCDVVLPKESVRTVERKLGFTLYGY